VKIELLGGPCDGQVVDSIGAPMFIPRPLIEELDLSVPTTRVAVYAGPLLRRRDRPDARALRFQGYELR
jgi:hypothetical protein